MDESNPSLESRMTSQSSIRRWLGENRSKVMLGLGMGTAGFLMQYTSPSSDLPEAFLGASALMTLYDSLGTARDDSERIKSIKSWLNVLLPAYMGSLGAKILENQTFSQFLQTFYK